MKTTKTKFLLLFYYLRFVCNITKFPINIRFLVSLNSKLLSTNCLIFITNNIFFLPRLYMILFSNKNRESDLRSLDKILLILYKYLSYVLYYSPSLEGVGWRFCKSLSFSAWFFYLMFKRKLWIYIYTCIHVLLHFLVNKAESSGKRLNL